MTLRELVTKNRTIRRFRGATRISAVRLRRLVDLARLSPSAANRQPLKYILVNTPGRNKLVFPCLAWAGYLKGWPGPAEGERPSAYIVVLGDTAIADSFDCDAGIAVQSIMLGAVEAGLGGCIVGSIERDGLRKALVIPRRYQILLVLALGEPAEKVEIETTSGSDIRYWRDDRGVHHVPKRRLCDVVLS